MFFCDFMCFGGFLLVLWNLLGFVCFWRFLADMVGFDVFWKVLVCFGLF